MQKLLMAGWILAYGLAFASYPVAGLIAGAAVEANLIAAHDPTAVEVNKAIFEPPKGAAKDSKAYRDAVMKIYGSQTDEPTAVVFVPKQKFVHPAELPTLTLLPVDKSKNENPLQVKTVYFFAPRLMLGFAVGGFVLTVVWIILRRKSKAAAPPPAVSKT